MEVRGQFSPRQFSPDSSVRVSGHIQDMKKNDFQPCSFTQKTVNVSYEYQNLPEIQKSFLDQLPI